MFGLFASPREKALKKANIFFQNQFSELCKWDDAKIGLVLDAAANIKMTSVMIDKSGQAETIYTHPSQVSEVVCLAQLEIYDAIMVGWTQEALLQARQNEGVSVWQSRAREKMHIKRAGLAVWYFSLVAGCFSEFRQNGTNLWNQLRRGYPHSELFNPDRDAIKEFTSNTPR